MGANQSTRNPEPNGKKTYPLLLPNVVERVWLDGELIKNGKLNKDNTVDTDGDGVPDWQSVDVDFLKKVGKYNSATDEMPFPTYKETLDYKNDLPYVQNWSGIPL